MDGGFSFSMMFEGDEAQPVYCAFSLKFRSWAIPMAQDFATRAKEMNSHAPLIEAKSQLLDKFYEWEKALDKKHPKRHLCIKDVMDEAYQILYATGLALTPYQFPRLPEPKRRKKDLPQPESNTSILGELLDVY